jgi:ABC-type dipeptide/oligopeptide/nickel transport system permease subunit
MMTENTGEETAAELGLGKHRTLLEEFWKNFKSNKLSFAGGVIIIIFALVAILAPFIAPYSPLRQFDSGPGEHHPLAPFSRGDEGRLFVFGTDKFGRDILSRAVFGCRTMLQLAVGAIAFSFTLGVIMGAVAGYNEGTWIDEVIMRIVDVMLSFPTLVLAVALIGAFGIGKMELGPITISNLFKIMLVIAITYSPRFARVMRGVVLQEMGEDYVSAAKVSGASNSRIIVKEIFLNTLPPIMVQASLMMATTILTSASLSFLGLGLQPPRPSLGIMLNEARGYLFLGAWWYALVPGLLISFAILGFNLLGDGLRDSLDPRQARQTRR